MTAFCAGGPASPSSAGADEPPHVAAIESNATSRNDDRRVRERRGAIHRMIEPVPDEEGSVTLALDSRDPRHRSQAGEASRRLAGEGAAGGASGPRRAWAIETVGDLLHHYPRRYIDRSRVETIRDLRGRCVRHRDRDGQQGGRSGRRAARQTMVTVTLSDETGLPRSDVLQPAVARLRLQGRAGGGRLRRRHALSRAYPAREPGGRAPPRRRRGPDPHRRASRRCTRRRRASRPGRSASWSTRRSSSCRRSPIHCPAELVKAESLSDYDQALRKIHFPEDQGQLARAQERLKFDELFTLELGRRVPQASRGGRAGRRGAHGVGAR